MKLQKLNVRRMPGFEDRGFEVDGLSDGLNLVVGPNASGKTTTCRAIRGLLWPETLQQTAPVSLVGQWVDDGHEVRLELEADRLTCQIDGQPSSPPAMPASHLAECYTVTVGTLIQATDSDGRLAATVLREMAGGYDLDAVAQQFTIPPRLGRKEMNDRQEAAQRVRALQQEQQSLQNEEDELADLEQEIQAGRRAQDRLARLEDVRQRLDVGSQIVETTCALEQLPPDMDRLAGNELSALAELQGDLDEAQRQREQARQQAADAQQAKDQAALPPEGIPSELLKEQDARLEQLRDLERQIGQADEELADAQAVVAQALARLGDGTDPDRLNRIDRAELDGVEEFHREAERLASRRTALEERLAVLGPDSQAEATDTLVQAVDVLRQWFEAAGPGQEPSRRDRRVAWALAAVLVAAGLVMGLWISLRALLIAAAGVAGGVALLLARPSAPQDARQACRQRFSRLGLEPPERWETEAVGRHLNQLEKRLAETRLDGERQLERRNRQVELDKLKAQAEALDRRRASLAQTLGVAVPGSDLSLVDFARDLLDYRRVRDDVLGLRAKRELLQGQRDEQLGAVNAYLARFGQEPCREFTIARVRCGALADRAERFRRADEQLALAGRAIVKADEAIEKLLQRRSRLYETAGLADGDETDLRERLSRLAEYRTLRSALGELQVRQRAIQSRLADVPELQELDRAQVDAEAARLQEQADRLGGLVDRAAGIRARVEQARRENRLQQALAAQDEATDRLAQRRDEARRAAAGTFLLDRVRQEQQAEHQPAVFRQARQWLSDFTRGRYDLRLSPGQGGQPAFRAYDNTQQRGLELDELSGGTRMQLLLAVRLAFAATAERGLQLPFVLDEALNGTDPVRFGAIVECLTALVRQGRQVFYLTCQPGDAEAWRQVAQQQGLDDAKLFDLARIRNLQQPAGTLLMASAAAHQAVPAPEGRSLSEYAAAVGVPAFDPAAGAAGLHVAHLLDDPDHLYALLRAGVQTYGQLRSLLDHGRADAFLPASVAQRMAARAVVVQATCDAWGIGRGRPLTREALSAAGVSDVFIDRVTDLAREVNWDARPVVQALEERADERARGFRANALAAVAEYLSAEGYLDPREPLAESEALSQVLSSANDIVRHGYIGIEEVRDLFGRFWSAAAGGQAPFARSP